MKYQTILLTTALLFSLSACQGSREEFPVKYSNISEAMTKYTDCSQTAILAARGVKEWKAPPKQSAKKIVALCDASFAEFELELAGDGVDINMDYLESREALYDEILRIAQSKKTN